MGVREYLKKKKELKRKTVGVGKISAVGMRMSKLEALEKAKELGIDVRKYGRLATIRDIQKDIVNKQNEIAKEIKKMNKKQSNLKKEQGMKNKRELEKQRKKEEYFKIISQDAANFEKMAKKYNLIGELRKKGVIDSYEKIMNDNIPLDRKAFRMQVYLDTLREIVGKKALEEQFKLGREKILKRAEPLLKKLESIEKDIKTRKKTGIGIDEIPNLEREKEEIEKKIKRVGKAKWKILEPEELSKAEQRRKEFSNQFKKNLLNELNNDSRYQKLVNEEKELLKMPIKEMPSDAKKRLSSIETSKRKIFDEKFSKVMKRMASRPEDEKLIKEFYKEYKNGKINEKMSFKEWKLRDQLDSLKKAKEKLLEENK